MSIITVTTAADSGNGSLRNAIATANYGDTIQFDKNLAQKTITLTGGQLVLNKDLTIDGEQAPGFVVSGNNESRVFFLDKKRNVTLKNLTIANGKTTGAGGGIDTRHESTITLENVNLHNNTSELGGGMRVGHLAKATILNSSFKGNDGTLTDKHKGFSAGAISHNESRGQLIIKGTTFENNKGFNGGAIYSFSGVSFVIEGSTFLNNTAENMEGGGAIFTDGVSSKGYDSGLSGEGKIVIRKSRFEGNKADGEGGALFLYGYTKAGGYEDDRATIEDSVFINNVAMPSRKGIARGGAVWAAMGLDISNTTFANNRADQQGGALWTESKLPINIANSTFSGNEVTQDAGGAMFLNNRSTPVNITNSTIAYNKSGRANGALWFDSSHNVTLKNSIVAFNTTDRDYRQSQVGYHANDGGGNVETSAPGMLKVIKNGFVADPLLAPLTWVDGAFVHPLMAGSPAIDAGVTQGAPGTDQRGAQRDSQVDIGAFEAGLAQSALLQAPVAHLGFDERSGSVAQDQSASGGDNSGNVVGGTSWLEDSGRNAIALYGEEVIELENSKDINLGKHSERTISLSFKAGETGANSGKQVLYEEGASVRGLNIYLDKGELYVGGWNQPKRESGWQGSWMSAGKVSADEWHRVDLVLEGGREVSENALRGYLDGEMFGSDVGSQLWGHSGGIGIGGIHRGTRFHDGVKPRSGSGFVGAIDEVMIFNDALTSGEIDSFI